MYSCLSEAYLHSTKALCRLPAGKKPTLTEFSFLSFSFSLFWNVRFFWGLTFIPLLLLMKSELCFSYIHLALLIPWFCLFWFFFSFECHATSYSLFIEFLNSTYPISLFLDICLFFEDDVLAAENHFSASPLVVCYLYHAYVRNCFLTFITMTSISLWEY